MNETVNYLRSTVEPFAYKYTIRLDRELTIPSDFQEELYTLRQATENDVVHILLNGPGGSDAVMKAFLSSMAQTPAHIITEIEGSCNSALTMIFLAGDEFRVSDDSEFMIHTASFGYGGKENNVRQFVEFNAKANERLMHKYYKHYLSPEEIEEVIEGKDVWHNADDIIERLEKRQKLLEAEAREENPELFQEFEVDFPEREEMEKWDKDKILDFIFDENFESDNSYEVKFEGEEGKSSEKLILLSEDPYYLGYHISEGLFDDGSGEKPFQTFTDIATELGIEDLKGYAGKLDIPYAHNISDKTLAKRIDEKVKILVDELLNK